MAKTATLILVDAFAGACRTQLPIVGIHGCRVNTLATVTVDFSDAPFTD